MSSVYYVAGAEIALVFFLLCLWPLRHSGGADTIPLQVVGRVGIFLFVSAMLLAFATAVK